jgi:AraC-like DNA-binding protein
VPAVTGQLRSLLDARCESDGFTPTADPSLTLFRTRVPGDPDATPGEPLEDPALCVVVAGRKRATVGTHRVLYEPGTYTLVSVELPVTDMVVEASAAEPFLGLRLALDPAILAELLVDLPAESSNPVPGWSMVASPLTGDLVDPLTRLLGQLDDRHDVTALAPATRREISYRLLRGRHGGLLRQLANPDSRLSQIKRAIDRIRADFAQPLPIAQLADVAAMSPSSFYQHFKQVTAMSPLQYQKQLRLHEARRLILDGDADATTAAFAVGYESPSQFSREYKRLFGAPPIRDVARLRSAS